MTRPSPALAALAALAVLAGALVFAAVFFGAVLPWTAGIAIVAVTLTALAATVPALLGRRPMPRDPMLLAWALLVLGSLLTLPASVNAWATLQWTARLVAFAAVYAIAAHVTPSRKDARVLAHVLLVAAAGIAAYGLVVTLTGREVVLYAAKTAYRDSLTATFVNRNHFAAFLCLSLLPALSLLAGGSRTRRALLLLPLAGGLLALALTLSRGGLLAFAGALPVLLALLARPQRKVLAVGALAGALALAGLLATNADRLRGRIEASFDPNGEPSAMARLSLWRSTLRATAERPVLGFGAGTFASFYPRFREVGIARRVSYAHQEYLELAAEQGVAGVALALAALVLAAAALRRTLATAGEDRPLVAGIIAGLVALGLEALVDFPFKIPAVPLWAAAYAGIAKALGEKPPPLPARASRVAAVVAALALGWTALVAARTTLADRHMRGGDAVFGKPGWDEAAIEYEAATRIDPGNPAAWDGLARTELNRMKFRIREGKEVRTRLAEAALAHFAEAEARDVAAPEYNLQRAWLFNFLGRPEEAAREFDLAIADDPANANVLFHAASFRLHRQETERGLELLGRAVRAWPNFFGGKIHEVDRAVGDPARLLAILPEDQPFLAYQYATWLLDEGRPADAALAFDRATALGGYRPHWVIPFAGLLARKESPAEAVRLYRRIPAAARTPGLEYELMKLLLLDGKREEAELSLAEASARNPRDPELVRLLVTLSGDSEAARTALERYLATAGATDGYEVAYGELLVRRGELEPGLAAYERALALAPASPHARAGVARCYRELARRAEARGACAEAEELEALALEVAAR